VNKLNKENALKRKKHRFDQLFIAGNLRRYKYEIKVIFSISLLLALPLTALTFYKQSRIVTPEWYGLICIDNYICLEDVTKKDDAKMLYDYAFKLTEKKLTKTQNKPIVIFCSSKECSKKFGLKGASAFNLGTLGIIISHKGWKKHLVSHEFIHYWQSSVNGNIKMLLSSNKQWLIEGMAYSMSEDPRLILAEPYQSYRVIFNKWLSATKKEDIVLAFKNESYN